MQLDGPSAEAAPCAAAGRPRPDYRGRIAPTPSGWLHMGHAATFLRAWQRARAQQGRLILRMEDIDRQRCKAAYESAIYEDLRSCGLDWDEGPDRGGAFGPYRQSERWQSYADLLQQLIRTGHVYPSNVSRAAILAAQPTRSPVDGEAIFPAGLRSPAAAFASVQQPCAWRFRVTDGETIGFTDALTGEMAYRAGSDFGDFVVWRKDNWPSYELAVVADDHAMAISEVVRGADLLLSTARQMLLYRALGWSCPQWCHTPLVMDPATGEKLSKSARSLALRTLRKTGNMPVFGS